MEYFFTEKVNNLNVIILFKRAVYLFILFNAIISLPIASQIWSTDSYLIHYYPFNNLLIKTLNVLSRQGVNNYYMYFLYGQIICCLACLAGFMKRIAGVLLYFISANLYFNAAQIQNGGTNILLITLFYLLFINEDAEKHKNEKLKIIDISVSNFAFFAAQIQVCILYFVSAVSKLQGTHWLDGSALYYVFNLDEYSTNWFRRYVANTNWITIPLTYFTLFFQLAFPVMVWIKKLKPITLIVGIIFHVFIIFIMGITDFGIIMLIMYILFLSENKALQILSLRKNKLYDKSE